MLQWDGLWQPGIERNAIVALDFGDNSPRIGVSARHIVADIIVHRHQRPRDYYLSP